MGRKRLQGKTYTSIVWREDAGGITVRTSAPGVRPGKAFFAGETLQSPTAPSRNRARCEEQKSAAYSIAGRAD